MFAQRIDTLASTLRDDLRTNYSAAIEAVMTLAEDIGDSALSAPAKHGLLRRLVTCVESQGSQALAQQLDLTLREYAHDMETPNPEEALTIHTSATLARTELPTRPRAVA